MSNESLLRQHLITLLNGRNAHVNFEDAIANFPYELSGKTPQGHEHSVWELLEHMRIAQWDILEFSINPGHVSPAFHDGYWPRNPAPESDNDWINCIDSFRKDLKSMQELVADPKTNLTAKIPHGTGQTILREALLVADHNAYHLGQLVLLRRALGIWPA